MATFPVGANKVPAVKGYLKIGPKVSSQLAMKFPDNDAFGFACRRNRITILDVDTPDERVLADALARHGPTPFIVRSGSGNYQAWYRRNGENRRVRPDPARPIDILGDGFVVAPPSVGSKGRYEIIQGTLDDLERLPTMRPAIVNSGSEQAMPAADPLPGNDLKNGDGRNHALWRHCMKAARGCGGEISKLLAEAMHHNQTFYQPLPDAEVLKIVASAWKYEMEGKNWFGHGARIVFEADEVDSLAASNPDAFALLTILRRHHWGRDFVLAKAFAESLGWTLPRFKSARAELLERKLIECVHAGGRGPKDPPLYRFG
ncbi:MAG: bifunctional DNA primase/polymerase [Aquamicrobium sp.]|nr:bifunctional DNA primase/polymerase [Aquamicrobium sp.]